ncbi:outer membrane protein [Labrys neptuniae]
MASTVASAADLALPAARPVAAEPAFDWTGFYAGASVGGRMLDSTWTATELRTPGSPEAGAQVMVDRTSPRDYVLRGTHFGGFVGYNFMVAPRWVAGVEADGGYAHGSRSRGGIPGCIIVNGCVTGASTPLLIPFGGDSARIGMGWDASLRARAGFLVTPDLLVYGTAGLALQQVKIGVTCGAIVSSNYCFGTVGQPGISREKTRTPVGWTVGAGVEWHVWGNWLLRAEYRFADYGNVKSRLPLNLTAIDYNTYRMKLKAQTHTLSLGLAYKF